MNKENKKIISAFIIVILIVIVIMMAITKNSDEKNISTDRLYDLHVGPDFSKTEILKEGKPTLLDVGGAECIPCKAMAPTLEKVNENLQGEAIVKFVDYWKYPALANQFEFNTIPTQFFYDENGELYEVHSGSITEEEIYEIFAEIGYTF